jgi:hypothetical protein
MGELEARSEPASTYRTDPEDLWLGGDCLTYRCGSLLQDALHRRREVTDVERLSKYGKSSEFGVGAKSCDKQYFGRIRQLRQAASELIAIEPGHHQIADHKVDFYARLLYYCQRMFAVCCSQDAIPLLLQRSGNEVADGVVIVDYQYRDREELRGGSIHVRPSLFSQPA